MPLIRNRKEIGKSIMLTTLSDKKFKTNMISVRFVTKHTEDTAAAKTVASSVVVSTNEKYPVKSDFTMKLGSLYGATISSNRSKYGDSLIIEFSANGILDSLALDGEKVLSELTSMLCDCIFRPYLKNGGFDENEFNVRKKELLDTIDAEINEKRRYAMTRAVRTVYENEPAAIPYYGSRESVESLTPQKAYETYLEMLKKAHIEIFIAGGGDFSEAAEILTGEFSKIKREPEEIVLRAISKPKPELKVVTEQLEVNQCVMVMAFKSEYQETDVNKIMSAVYGGTPFSKLFANVREKLSLCYFCYSGFWEDKGTLLVISGVDKKNISLAREEISNQLSAMANGDFTDDDLENTKRSINGDVRSSYDTVEDVVSWFFNQWLRGTNMTVEERISRNNSITREEVTEAAKSLKPDSIYILESRGGEENA